jgi:hypothetical protein
LSDAKVAVARETALAAPSRFARSAFAVAAAACARLSSSDARMVSYCCATTPSVFWGANGLGPARFMKEVPA